KCDTIQILISLDPVNDAPIAQNDLYIGLEDEVLVIDVQANDSDVENTAFVTTVILGPYNGTTTVINGDSVNYEPTPNYFGKDSFQYSICEPTGECDSAWVYMTLDPVNDAPLALRDTVSVPEDITITIDVQDNDTDVDGGILTTSMLNGPSNGAGVVINGDSILYTPNPNFFGDDTITYRVCDASGACDTAILIIRVLPINDPPIAENDSTETINWEQIDIIIGANDTDVDDSTLVYTVINGPFNGMINQNGDTITYVPETGNCAPDSFQYSVCDPAGACDTGWVFIEVNIPDSDGDGLPDMVESKSSDGDDDGFPDFIDPDSDNDGISDGVESFGYDHCLNLFDDIPDSDGDGIPNYLDIDSDNDGILDSEESVEDCDGDGIPDYRDADYCNPKATPFDVLNLPNGFSPNNDGMNDTWVIDGLENFPDNELVIFNRWGNQVFSAKGYKNDWNGVSNGKFTLGIGLPVGTYFYALIISHQGQEFRKADYIYLTR
ncbi:MAG: gliding motility-associated-like protein, partial [Sphingobacteriales bacterium]